jgi:hypothetical protein
MFANMPFRGGRNTNLIIKMILQSKNAGGCRDWFERVMRSSHRFLLGRLCCALRLFSLPPTVTVAILLRRRCGSQRA